jgi:hypothetical protein
MLRSKGLRNDFNFSSILVVWWIRGWGMVTYPLDEISFIDRRTPSGADA